MAEWRKVKLEGKFVNWPKRCHIPLSVHPASLLNGSGALDAKRHSRSLLQPKSTGNHTGVFFFFFSSPLAYLLMKVVQAGEARVLFGLVGLWAVCPGARSQSLLIGLAIQPGLPTVSLCEFQRGQGECTTGQAYETLTTHCAFTVRGRLRVRHYIWFDINHSNK